MIRPTSGLEGALKLPQTDSISEIESIVPENHLENHGPKKPVEEVKINFDYGVSLIAKTQTEFIAAYFNRLCKIDAHIRDHFHEYERQAEDINAFLSRDQLPALDPSSPVPAYAMAKVRSALYREMGPLFRYLFARRLHGMSKNLILIGLFGHVPAREVKLSSQKPKIDFQSLKFSVMARLHLPFSELSEKEKMDRLHYYEFFYAKLDEKEGEIEQIRANYQIYAPSNNCPIDWTKREIEVTAAFFESIMYLARTEFRDLFQSAIDSEMEVRIIYIILQVVFGTAGRLYFVPDEPAVFVIKGLLLDVKKQEIKPEESCASFLLNRMPLKKQLSNFVKNVLLPANVSSICVNEEEFPVGGPEYDFPIDAVKRHFLMELKKCKAEELVQTVRERPFLKCILGNKEKLSKMDLIDLFQSDIEKFNAVKKVSQGNFIITRLNQIFDGIVFSEEELESFPSHLIPYIDFLFPIYLLQVFLMTSDSFSNEIKTIYRRDKCLNAHMDKAAHFLVGLDSHQFVYKTSFFKELATSYTIYGTLSLESFWSLGKVVQVPYKRIKFSPAISIDELSNLCDNIFLEYERDTFLNEIIEQYLSICQELESNQPLMTGLKEKLVEILSLREILLELKADNKRLVDAHSILKSLEEKVRTIRFFARDAVLSDCYIKIYGEHGFLRNDN